MEVWLHFLCLLVFPAYAGVILPAGGFPCFRRGFPRTRGGDSEMWTQRCGVCYYI